MTSTEVNLLPGSIACTQAETTPVSEKPIQTSSAASSAGLEAARRLHPSTSQAETAKSVKLGKSLLTCKDRDDKNGNKKGLGL